ncbi:hypothetical protein PR001_g28871, partial [Phytophthora rubi]
ECVVTVMAWRGQDGTWETQLQGELATQLQGELATQLQGVLAMQLQGELVTLKAKEKMVVFKTLKVVRGR